MPALTIILTPPVSQSSLIFLSVTTDNAPAAPLIWHHRHLVTAPGSSIIDNVYKTIADTGVPPFQTLQTPGL